MAFEAEGILAFTHAKRLNPFGITVNLTIPDQPINRVRASSPPSVHSKHQILLQLDCSKRFTKQPLQSAQVILWSTEQ